MDLFKPVVPHERFHPNFATIFSQQNPYDQAVISKWADGFVDRDGKFVEEFQTTFNSSFWELYLHAVLKDAGCSIDFSHHAPDFVVSSPVPFVVEATVALNAADALPEWTDFDIKQRPRDLNEFNRTAMIRLLNSISGKTKKYRQSYASLPHVAGKPFVLGVNPFDQPFFYLQVQRAIEAVLYGYYVDEQEYIDDPAKASSISPKELTSVRKGDSVNLPLGIFNDNSHEHISAVIFNSTATWGKVKALSHDPYPFVYFNAARFDPRNGEFFAFKGTRAAYFETLFDGLRVYHNPNALHPLDWGVFEQPGVYQAVCTHRQSPTWRWAMDRPPLIARNLMTLNVPKEKIEVLQKELGEGEQGGWYKVPFSSALLAEIAGMQKEDVPLA